MKSPTAQISLDLPDDDVAQAVARFLAQKFRYKVVVRDSDNYELWTIRPKLNS
jgi:hypothetical protein